MKVIPLLIAVFLTSILLANRSDSLAKLNVDSIVKGLKTNMIKDPDELAAVIVQPFSTDTFKIRAIYCWVIQNIAYNYSAYKKGTQHLPYNGEDIDDYYYKRICKTISTKKGVCEDYALVFQYLCKACKINCGKLSGWALVTKPRDVLKLLLSESSSNRAWNVVMINKKWYLIDATFASGYIDSEKDKFVRSQNDYYYLTSPSDFILDHHPTDSKWQLLEKPLSIKEFVENAKYNRESYLDNSTKAHLDSQNKGRKSK